MSTTALFYFNFLLLLCICSCIAICTGCGAMCGGQRLSSGVCAVSLSLNLEPDSSTTLADSELQRSGSTGGGRGQKIELNSLCLRGKNFTN